MFLFAVVRDVQRNTQRRYTECISSTSFYSLSCETYSGTIALELIRREKVVSIRCRARRTAELDELEPGWQAKGLFLFAVVRDVQRNSP